MIKSLAPLLLPAVAIFFLLPVPGPAGEPGDATSAPEKVRLPGIEIDAEKGTVDVKAKVCLEYGLLELIACTRGTKEHESIVAIEAEPIHVHTALLLIGARHGNPAMRKPINEEETRWRHLPPRGDAIQVSLVVTDGEGKKVERPIRDFVRRTEGDPSMSSMFPESSGTDESQEQEPFPNTFVFAGSHLIENEEGVKQYLAAQSGHVITISTFGDDLLCLAGFQSRANGELIWEIDPTHLPALDSEVILRLRPQPES